ncbi:MAG: 6-phosphogluconolactonase [Niameybacter sp.]
MKVVLSKDDVELGIKAAKLSADIINEAIMQKGYATIVMSTGASQFTTISQLIKQDIDWSKVTMFHLDEYIDLDENHPASFIKYLKERFVSKVNLKKVNFVDTSIGVQNIIDKLTLELGKEEVDLGLIGIGENAHIAFNDPPADFETTDAFKVVQLNEACRNQQYREGWFDTLEDVPTKALSMTVNQILKCKKIISAVPYKVKAKAIYDTLSTQGVTNMIPATILKTHTDVTIFVDEESASLIKFD